MSSGRSCHKGKIKGRGGKIMKFILIAVYMLLSASGLILFKKGSQNGLSIILSQSGLNLKISYFSILGILSYGCSFLLYLFLVSKFNLSYIVPITTGLMYVVIFIASALVFKEKIDPIHLIGAIVVLFGVILINK